MAKDKDIKKETAEESTDKEINDSEVCDDDENGSTLEDTDDSEEAPKEPDDPIKDLEEKLQAAETEAKESYDRFLRLSAEFENYKKRSSREMDEFRKFANEVLIKDLLSVVDNLERAIDSSDGDNNTGDNVVEGVDLILKEVLKILEKFGVSRVDCAEKPFDPSYHQAVMQEESDDFSDNTVIKELQKGYLLHDRLLRPSMVVVSKQKASKDKNAEVNQEKG